jgi:hypothetical protein
MPERQSKRAQAGLLLAVLLWAGRQACAWNGGMPLRSVRSPRTASVEIPVGGGLTAYPQPVLGENLLANPSFEQIRPNNKPEAWSDNGFSSDTTVARTGAASYLLADADRIPYSQSASQRIWLRKGVYHLRLWVRVEGLAATRGSGVRACLSAPPSYPWSLVRVCTSPVKGTADWQELALAKVVVPQDTPAAVSLESYGEPDGKAWFDDAELRREENPLDVFLLYPNYRGLLFDDQSQVVRLQVSVDPPGGEAQPGWLVRVTVTDESESRVVQEENFPAEAAGLVSLDFSGLPLNRSYLITAQLWPQGAPEPAAQYPPYRVWKVPGSLRQKMTVSFDEQNRILLRGKPSFLLGVYDAGLGYGLTEQWWDTTLTTARRLFELPINVYLNYWYGEAGNAAWIPMMNLLHSRGIYALTNANCFASSPLTATAKYWFVRAPEEDIRERAAHPGFLGFYAADECAGQIAPDVFPHAQRMRNLDPDGIVFGTLLGGPHLPLWRDVLDVLATDPYPLYAAEPEGGYPLGRVAEWTEQARRAVHGARPIVTVIQFFQFTSKGRWPTQKELRDMSYMAIASGANGLLYWSLGTNALAYVCKDWCEEKAEYFQRLKAVLEELKSLEEVLASPDRPDLLVSVSDPEAIRTRVKYHDGKVWLIAANVTSKQVRVSFVLREAPRSVQVWQGSETLTLEGPEFRDTFGPYEARIHEIR